MGDEYGHGEVHQGAGDRQTDVYGNHMVGDVYGQPVRQTDEYGKPVHHTTTMGDYSTTGTLGAYRTDHTPTAALRPPILTGTGSHESHFRRSDSSSSSSSVCTTP